MAHFSKTKSGWRAQIERKGVRKSMVFPTKAAAAAWAAQEEAKILSAERGGFPNHTLADALDKYEKEVSRHKRGYHAEALRFNALQRDFPDLCAKVIHKITPEDLGRWRDARRAVVSDSSVQREAAQLRNVWTVATLEWGWCPEPSPWRRVKLPPKGHARTRQSTQSEIKRLVRHMGYTTGKAPTTPQQEVAWAYLVAHHSAMRSQELLSLSTKTVNLATRVARLDTHKTLEREGVRWVPFTRKTARLLSVLDAGARAANRERYFTISEQSLDVLFRKVRDRLLIDNLHFRDSRASALTRLSKRMDVFRLARISGHRDLNQLLRAYYRETAAEVAASI